MTRTLNQGVTGQDVRILQDRLNYHLRRETPLKVDGIFGPLTRARTSKFQTVNGLKADGIVGPRTKAELFETDVVNAQVMVMPDLTLPTFAQSGGRFGINTPRLIPQLTPPSILPQQPQLVLPPPVLFGPRLTLGGVSAASFSPVNQDRKSVV